MRQKGANEFLTNLNGGDKKCRIKIGVLRAVAVACCCVLLLLLLLRQLPTPAYLVNGNLAKNCVSI